MLLVQVENSSMKAKNTIMFSTSTSRMVYLLLNFRTMLRVGIFNRTTILLILNNVQKIHTELPNVF